MTGLLTGQKESERGSSVFYTTVSHSTREETQVPLKFSSSLFQEQNKKKLFFVFPLYISPQPFFFIFYFLNRLKKNPS